MLFALDVNIEWRHGHFSLDLAPFDHPPRSLDESNLSKGTGPVQGLITTDVGRRPSRTKPMISNTYVVQC